MNIAQDKIGVTTAFDGWSNVKQERFFIISTGETLIWGANDISNVINHIKNIIVDAEKKNQNTLLCFRCTECIFYS